MVASMWPGWRWEAWQLKESQGVGWWVSVISGRLRLILLWWLMKLCLGWEFFGAVFPKEKVSRYSKPKRSYNERSLGMTVSKQLDFFTAGLLSACTTPVCVMNLQNGVRLLKFIWPWSCLPAAATTNATLSHKTGRPRNTLWKIVLCLFFSRGPATYNILKVR